MSGEDMNVWLGQHVIPKGLSADEPIELTNAHESEHGIVGTDMNDVRTLIPWASIRFVDLPERAT